MGGKGAGSVGQMCVFLVSTLFHYGCPLHCTLRSRCGGASVETLWPGRDLNPPSPPPAPTLFRCSVQRCSSGLRGKFFLAVPLTTGNQPIEIVLPPLTEQHVHSLHFLTKICHSNPEMPATVKGDYHFFGGFLSLLICICVCFFFSSSMTNTCSPSLRQISSDQF